MQAIQNVHLRWKCKTRRVSVYPCRGVLHTPHRYPVRGKRKACDDQMCKMIFGPKGRLWGVCNTPLPEKMKIWLASLMPWFSFASFLASRQEKKNRVEAKRRLWRQKYSSIPQNRSSLKMKDAWKPFVLRDFLFVVAYASLPRCVFRSH